MIKVITFDLDDTLWDVTPVLQQAERVLYDWLAACSPAAAARYSPAALRALRLTQITTQPALTHQITESRRLTLRSVLHQAGMSQTQADEKAREGIAVFLEARHQVALYPGIEALLAELAPHYTLGALTNGNADVYRLAIGRHFSFAFSAEMLDSSKPLPAHFDRTEQETGATAQEILHIGDHAAHDIDPAAQRGWHTIWLKHERTSASPAAPPSATIHHASDLPTAIQNLIRQALDS